MSISSYAELQTAAGNWLHRSDLTSILPDLILLGEERIAREVRAPEMETALSAAISSGVLAVPTGFLAFKNVYIDGSPIYPLQPKSLDWLHHEFSLRSSDAKPRFIARNGGNFEFGPYPNSDYTVKGTYYAKPTSVASSWNALATAYPDLYLLATLAEAAPYAQDDDRIAVWEGKYQAIRDDINRVAKEGEFSGSPLSVTPA